ncbi:hypothetical protein ACET3Z_014840 [Daucus carota]
METGVSSSKSIDGEEDVFSSKQSDVSSADHLVVMVHGIMGSTANWKFAAEQFVRMLPDKVYVHRSEKNMAMLTLDGVDVMGERLAEEVFELIKQKPNLRKISFVAHSLGGLAARYAIGKLYKPPKTDSEGNLLADAAEESKGTIGGLVPINFITVATPHLGSRGNNQVPFLFGVTALEKVAAGVSHLIFKRTGRHLFLTDDDNDGKPPLLKRMVEDHEDCYFMSGLRSFKRRVAYSNVGYDHIVGWRTASIRRAVELPKWEDSVNKKYPHVVHEEFIKACDAGRDYPIPVEDDSLENVEEELVTGLSRVSWEKVDVSFHSSSILRFAAHSVIQVKDENIHSEGADKGLDFLFFLYRLRCSPCHLGNCNWLHFSQLWT